MELLKRNADLLASFIIICATSTLLASNSSCFIDMLICDASIRIATSLLVGLNYISSKTKEFVDYISGGLIFAASYHYCKQSISLLVNQPWLEKAIITGFIPMLSINFNSKITDMLFLDTENNIDDKGYCLINAFKFTFFQAIKAFYTPARYSDLATKSLPVFSASTNLVEYRFKAFNAAFMAYFISGMLCTGSVASYFCNLKENFSRSFVSANNSYIAATIADTMQPYISSNFTTYDLLYSSFKKSLDIAFC